MPWTANDALRHNKSLKSSKSKRQWADVANSVLKKTGDESRAVRAANSVAGRGTNSAVKRRIKKRSANA